MRETGRSVELVLFLSGKNHACPFAPILVLFRPPPTIAEQSYRQGFRTGTLRGRVSALQDAERT